MCTRIAHSVIVIKLCDEQLTTTTSMTLSTFFKDTSPSNAHSILRDRGHISYEPSWKGSGHKSKDYQSALSALTLVAFLFFLNMLQSCLQDSLQSQAPITIMMTTVTTTTQEGTKRQKRSNIDKTGHNRNMQTISEHQYKDSNYPQNDRNIEEIEKTVEATTVKSTTEILKHDKDYKIFVLDENITPNETTTRNKLDKIQLTQFSNWLNDKCCKCERLHRKEVATDDSERILRSGIYSLMCEFIQALNVQTYCKHHEKCEFSN